MAAAGAVTSANVGDISLDGITPFFQIPRVVVPAGMNDTSSSRSTR